MTGEVILHGVGKSYRQWGGEWRRALSWFRPSLRPAQENWVLQDVNLRVGKGEVVGVIGQNGAGKSTLLKLITGTIQATTGGVHVSGRISAILELGMGFNPEMTGRQNAAHAAGLMGIPQQEVHRAMPEIEAFAELGEYFDKELRTYSSGMQMRVAFGVATAFRPDVLIIDEALSVGDSYFQHKSFERIRQFKADGVSILFVTHGMADVRSLCDRVILLDRGKVLREGAPDEVVDYYNALITEKENATLSVEQRRQKNGWMLTRSGTGEAKIDSISLVDHTAADVAVCRVGQALTFRIRATVTRDLPRLVVGLMIRDKLGHVVWGTNTWHTQQTIEEVDAGTIVTISVPWTCTLGPGSYSITTALTSSQSHVNETFDWIDNVLVFEVVNFDLPFFVGSSWLDARFETEREA